MHKHAYLSASMLSLVIGLAASSAAQAEMATYACQFDPAEPAGLTVNYDTATGQFALVDYYGASNLPAGVQVSAFAANGPELDFSLGIYDGANLQRTDRYRFEFLAQKATLERQSGGVVTASFVATCSANDQAMDPVGAAPASAATSAPAATAPIQVVMPSFYGEELRVSLQPQVLAAVQRAQQNPAVGTPSSQIAPQSNSICSTVYGSNDDPYIQASWCASTQLESDDFAYGGILGFISPDTEYGRRPAWCTGMGGHGNFGQGHSIEMKYWLPRDPAGISALVIRSGTGIPDISPYFHSKPKVLRVETPDMTWTWALESTTEFQAIAFTQPIHSRWIRVVIEDAYMGDTWSNICISDLFAVFEPNED